MDNKYILLSVVFLYLIIITIIADSVGIVATSGIADGIDTGSQNASLGSIFGLLSTFWKMITFQVQLPILAIIIFIYPAVIIVIAMLIDIIKDLIPFT